MENTALLFGPDSVWVNVSYGDRLPKHEGDEQCVQPEPRPLDALKYEKLDISYSSKKHGHR